MIKKPIPARIDVFLAPKAHKAVVLRRGPAKQVCTIGWDLKTNKFQMGQWFKGRIYENFCDLSPDGKYFIYPATKGKQSRLEDKRFYNWTAISRAPFLTAICLWKPMAGSKGGGIFCSNRSYWVIDPYQLLIDSTEVYRDRNPPTLKDSEMYRLPYFYRLVRDGWVTVDVQFAEYGFHVPVFDREINDRFTIRRVVHYQGTGIRRNGQVHHREAYFLVDHKMSDKETQVPWDWAEHYRNKLLWAEAGKLFSARIGKETIGKPVMLRDFNDMKFEALKAPY